MTRRLKLRWFFTCKLFLAMVIGISILPIVNAEQASVPIRVEQIDIVGTLTTENQIEFSKTIGYTLNYSSSTPPPLEDTFVMPPFELSTDSVFAINSVKVAELINNRNFIRVFHLNGDCDGQFTFDQSTNIVQLCMRLQPQVRIEFKGIILDKRNLSVATICANPTINYPLQNQFSTDLPVFDYSYYFSATARAGDGVKLNIVNQSACQSESVDLIVNKLSGGFYCQGTVLPKVSELKAKGFKSPAIANMMNLAGNNTKEIEKVEQTEIARLQKENINASIMASAAAVTSSNAARTTTKLTGVLAFLTAVGAALTYFNIRENKKVSKPIIKVKLEPFGTGAVVLRVVNIGKSSATNIHIKYQILPEGSEHHWRHHLFQENDFVRLTPKESQPFLQFLDTKDKIKIESSWEDPHRNRYKEYYEINLKEYKKSIEDSLWILDTTQKEDFEKIAKNITEIAHTLKSKSIDIEVKDVDLNPEKFEAQAKLFKMLYVQKEAQLAKLKSQNGGGSNSEFVNESK